MVSGEWRVPIRYSPLAIRPLRSRLYLGYRQRGHLRHLGPELLLRDGGARGLQIGRHLADHIGVAALSEFGCDDLPGIRTGGLAGDSELFGRPQSQQPVAARFGFELLLLVEGELLLETF